MHSSTTTTTAPKSTSPSVPAAAPKPYVPVWSELKDVVGALFDALVYAPIEFVTGKELTDHKGNPRNKNAYYGSNHKGSPW
jgi:hypothetical protein